MVTESHLDILHVGASTGKDDATQQTVGILLWYLIPYILDDLLCTALYDLHKLPAFHGAVGIDADHLVVVDLTVICPCAGIFQFHILGIALLHLQGSDILGDIVAA